MDKFIVNFSDHNPPSGANTDTVTLGDSMSVSAHNSITQHSFHDVSIIEQNPYATFFTLALPTNGWSNRTKKFNPSLEEQSEYFETNFNNIVFTNHNPFEFMYSLEYNEDMAHIHAHGVIHECHTEKELSLFKKEIRKIFKILPTNRIAIKYYKTDELYLNQKYHYHIGNMDYNHHTKNKVKTTFTKVRR